MARRELSVRIDEVLVDAIARAAREDGRNADEVVEEALRRYFGLRGLAALDDIAERRRTEDASQRLTEEEVIELAVREVRAQRAERAKAQPGA